ncbi:MAG: ATP-binding protein [Clostridia bacterium]|nr:ATP-binding protein [Clostridia bacterium]
MNKEYERVLDGLPAAPDFQFNWDKLNATCLKPLIDGMRATQQNPGWHGEGDVWTHTKMVCGELERMEAFRSLPDRQRTGLALAALLHDAGKIHTTRMEDGILVSPGHALTGSQMARTLLWTELGLSGSEEAQRIRETACLLIRYHTTPLHLVKDEDAVRRARRIASNGRTAADFTLNALFMLAEADVRGRICADQAEQLDEIELARLLAEEAGCLTGPYAFPSECTEYAYLSGRNVWENQALFDDCWGEAIILCGLPGTGKDTWIQKNCPSLPVVSLDDIRRAMKIRPEENQGVVIQAAREQAKVHLRAHQPFVWNATSLTPTLRQNQTGLFENYGAAVRIVYLETEWQENLERNENRRYAVPEPVFMRMLDKLEPPEAFEARKVEWLIV